MSSYLLDRERKQAQQALRNEDQKYLVAVGAYRLNEYERTIEFWTEVMPHDCSNKGAEIRNQQQHQLNERLRHIEPLVMTGDLGYLYFVKAED